MSDAGLPQHTVGSIASFTKSDKYYNINYTTGEQARLYILNSHVFRFYMSPSGNFLDHPQPKHPSHTVKINERSVEEYDNKHFLDSIIDDNGFNSFDIRTNEIIISFDKKHATMKVCDTNRLLWKDVLQESRPLTYADDKAKQTLHHNEREYFFGGGMQNGRFSHKGKVIKIAITNNWLNHGVSSPCPFYWSTNGYGVLRNTWQPGVYDFGFEYPHFIITIHEGTDFDAFYFINEKPKAILSDYYELTGYPIFMPEYAFYQAHSSGFNEDYWVEVNADTPSAVLFEDGEYYKKFQRDQVHREPNPILKSLNGEKNYQFSARAMISRYQIYDMPLGWFIPNDNYNYISGYGHTNSLAGDIQNLKIFVEYAKENGVHVALMRKYDLEPEDPAHPKKGERDLHKEVSEAGVVALKCDVTSVGNGYSFAANTVQHAAQILEKASKHHRKMIIMVDGWAGTQRHAGVWTGDQSGGEWEYIRFHIPTYIGSGLSGIPVIGSDIDGIFKGGVKNINIRDFQWKAFTPMQINRDGWGSKARTPFSYDKEATAINRAYLKLKSMMFPYNYTIAHKCTLSSPMIRAMFLEFPQEKQSYTLDSQYQFMWGRNLLIAPVYNEDTHEGEYVRHGIYLPKRYWIDFFTGEKYRGGRTLNYIKCPLWKIPVFVREGAIIPMTNANNHPGEIERDNRIFNIYPNKKRFSFQTFEDDGASPAYLQDQFAATKLIVRGSKLDNPEKLNITIERTDGSYEGMVKERTTLLRIMASIPAFNVKATVNGESLQFSEVYNKEDFDANDDVYFFDDKYVINPYLKVFGGEKLHQKFLMIKIKKLDVTASDIEVEVSGFIDKSKILHGESTFTPNLNIPAEFAVKDEDVTTTSLSPSWKPVDDAVFYEISRDGDLFTNIVGTKFLFDYLNENSTHTFSIRSVNHHGHSGWSDAIHITTKSDLYKDTVKGVKVTCNLTDQPHQNVENLTDADESTVWHTNCWGDEGKAKPRLGIFINLSFDLGAIYAIKKVEYKPRKDAGNGTILQLKYTTSADGATWKALSNDIKFANNANSKEILLNGLKFRYMNVTITESVGRFGSGINFMFYKEVP